MVMFIYYKKSKTERYLNHNAYCVNLKTFFILYIFSFLQTNIKYNKWMITQFCTYTYHVLKF